MIDNDRGENPYLQRRLLRVAVAARYAQSLVMGAYSYSQVSDQPFQWVWSFIVLFDSQFWPNFILYTENEALTFFHWQDPGNEYLLITAHTGLKFNEKQKIT